ncbi:MAG: T9SS type A sorting domain-containing protein [Flavobacteriales bacterium]|nr:T9SS type A sorting domain-containing protein [Flavobacteriales bacterium]
MTQRYASLFILLSATLAALAQPTIPSGNSSFAPGESYTIRQGAYFTPPASGVANATWDYSGYTSTSTIESAWVAPAAGAPFGTTVSEYLAPGVYGHYKATANSFEQIGQSAASSSLGCSNGILLFTYPFTFDDVVNDTYACTGSTFGESFTRTGTVDIEGASWGTLILPHGTFTNVLLIDIEQHHEDVLASDPEWPTNYNAFTQFFVKPGLRHPLLANYEVYQVPGQLFTYSRMLDASEVGVAEALNNAIGIDLLPNPARDQVDVVFGSGADRITLEVIDATGKVVLVEQHNAQGPGIQRQQLDLSSLQAGVYSVRVINATGAMGIKRLVVE